MVGAFLRHKTSLFSGLAYLPPAIKETEKLREESRALLKVMDLDDVEQARAVDLPYGKQRRLEIARAMATQPDLLLLDEPAAGMNPLEKTDLQRIVRRLRDVPEVRRVIRRDPSEENHSIEPGHIHRVRIDRCSR